MDDVLDIFVRALRPEGHIIIFSMSQQTQK